MLRSLCRHSVHLSTAKTISCLVSLPLTLKSIDAGTALGRYDGTFRGARRFAPFNNLAEFEDKPAGPAGIYSR
jgi:hypothetical protein